uniref:Uncharacterized protein n=1 Tax=Brassica campestris TaxID=3711 RepID=M4DEX2_BRACM
MHFCFSYLEFSEHQMSKSKKNEEISEKREKEIQQVSACNSLMLLIVNLCHFLLVLCHLQVVDADGLAKTTLGCSLVLDPVRAGPWA